MKLKQVNNKDTLKRLCSNSHCTYLHFLPPTGIFPGGLVNFRQIETYSKTDFNAKYLYPKCQISPFFIKDIISRFSSYYARQGQPDLNFDSLVSRFTEPDGAQ